MSGIALALILSGAVIIRGALKGLNPVEAFNDAFDRSLGGAGIPGRISGGGIRTGGGGSNTTGAQVSERPGASTPTFSPDVERWRGMVANEFPAQYVNQALSVMYCESRGNPNALNPISNASGLFQHLPKYWESRSRSAGVAGSNIFEPYANVRVAAWLFRQSNTWDHWSCKPSVK